MFEFIRKYWIPSLGIIVPLLLSFLYWGLLVDECGMRGAGCHYDLRPDAHGWYKRSALHGPIIVSVAAGLALTWFLCKRQVHRIRFVMGLIVLIGMAVTLGSAYHWEGLGGIQSPSETVRNVGLATAAPFILIFAAWRARIADAQSQTARLSLMNERYQNGAELIGSSILATRLGGIYALLHLAQEDPQTYHVIIMRLLCSFVRHPPNDSALPLPPIGTREDVQAAMDAIAAARRTRGALDFEKTENYRPDLAVAQLRGANLACMDLSGMDFAHADFSCASLSGSKLIGSHLFDVRLDGSDLSQANLSDANLSGAKLISHHHVHGTHPAPRANATTIKFRLC